MENELGLDLQGADNCNQFNAIYTEDGPTTVIVVDESIDLSTITGISDLLNCSAEEISIIADPTHETQTLPLNIEHAENQSNDYGQSECKSATILEDQSKQVVSEIKTPNQSFQREACTLNKARNFSFQIIQPNAKKSHNVHQERSIELRNVGEMNKRQIKSREVTLQNSWIFSEFANELGVEDGEKDNKMIVSMAEIKNQMDSQKLGGRDWSNAEVSIKLSEKEKKPVIFDEEINNFANDKLTFKRPEVFSEKMKEKTNTISLEVETTRYHGNRFNPQYGMRGKEEYKTQSNRYEEKRRFKCTLCKERFDKIELLMKHRARDHFLSGKKLSFDCSVCRRSFKSVTSLQLHKRIHKRDGPVKCNKCAAQFTLKACLLKHLPLCGSPDERKRVLKNRQRILREKRHTNRNEITKANTDHKCFHCSKCFSSQIALTTHKTRVHNIVKPKIDKKGQKGFHVLDLEKCSESEKQNLSFSRNKFWNVNHIVSEGDWKKSVGRDQFRSNKDLERKQFTENNYIETHTNSLDLMKGNVFQCLYCRQCFRGATEVKKHVRVHRTICCDCGKKALDLPRLRRHRLNVHNSLQDGIFECPRCKKKHGAISDLLRHMKDHVGPWICEREGCLAQFSERSELVAHRKAHGNPYPDQAMTLFDGTVSEKDMEGLTLQTIDDFIEKSDTFTETSIGRVQAVLKCKICREQFASTTTTRKHIKMVHLRDSKKKFQCDQCDFSTHFGYIIKQHQKKHRGQFSCNICGKSFDTKDKLDNHVPYHNKDRYQCYYCGKQFISRKKCIDHVSTYHTDKKKQSDKLDVTIENDDSFDEQTDVTLKDRVKEERVKFDPDMGEPPSSNIGDKDQTRNHTVGRVELGQRDEEQADNAYGSSDVLFGESSVFDTDIEMAHVAEDEYGRNIIEKRGEEKHSGTMKLDPDLENVTYIDSCGQTVQYIPQKNEKTYSITPQTIQVPNSDVTLELYEDGTIVTKDTQGTNFSAINFEALGIDLGSLEGKTDIEFIIAQADGTEVKAVIQADIDRSSDLAQEVTNELNHTKNDVKFDKQTSVSDVENLYQCSKCPRTFKFLNTYQNHEEMYDVTHTCPQCQSGFAATEVLSSHLELHKEQEDKNSKSNKGMSDLNCSYCGKIFNVEYKLNRHISNAHELKSGYACPYCGRVFRFKSEVQAHVMVHVGPFECSFCVEECTTHEELLDHVREEHAFKTYICPICKSKCGCKNRFKEHVKQEHSVGAEGSLLIEAFRVYKCNECDAKFEKPSQLLRHQQTHSGKKVFACSFCCAEFYSKSKMNEHLRQCHWEQFKQRYSYIGDEFLIKEDSTKKQTSGQNKGLQTQNQSEKTSELDAMEVDAIEAPGIAVQNNCGLGSSVAVGKPENRQHSLTKHSNSVASEVQMVCPDLKTEEPTDLVMCDHCGLYFLHLEDLNQHLQDQDLGQVSHVELEEDCSALAACTATADLTPSDLTVSRESKQYQFERKFEHQSSHEILTEWHDKGLASRKVGEKPLNKLPEQEVKENAKRGRKPKVKIFQTLKAGRDDKLDLPGGILKQKRRYDSSKANRKTRKDDIVSFLGENFNLRKVSSALVKEEKSKLHKCFICGERFSRESMLLKHSLVHDGNADIDDKIENEHNFQPLVFECQECGNMYATSLGLVSHVKHKHPGITLPVGISKADNTYTTESVDGEIITRVGKEKRSSVKEIKDGYKYSLSSYRKTNKHKALIQRDRQENYQCTNCKAMFRTYAGILYHLKNIHSLNFFDKQTQLSPTKVSTSGRVIKKSHKTFDQIQCEICFKQFSFESYLTKHMQNKHPAEDDVDVTRQKSSFCKLCNKSFKKLGIHMYHKHIKNYILGKDKSDLGASKNSVGDIMEKTGILFECAYCQTDFQTLPELHEHVLKHEEQNMNILNEKEKTINQGILKERSKNSLDLNTRRYEVRTTGESGTNSLKNEKKSRVKTMVSLDNVTDSYESRLMLHKCKVCYKSFESRQSLTEHKLRNHRSFNCSHCGQDFESRKAAAAHEMIHQRKKFECPECLKTFSWKISFKHHMRKFHNIWDLHMCDSKPLPSKTGIQSCLQKHKSKQKSITSPCHQSDNVKHDQAVKQRVINKEEKMTCNICNISFDRKRHLLEHMLSHTSIKSNRIEEFHQTVKKKPKEGDRKKSVMLSKKEDLQNRRNKMKEMRRMRGRRKGAESRVKSDTDSASVRKADVKCSLCTKLFINEFNLHDHVLHVHKKLTATSKRRFCTICRILFKTESKYTEHLHTLHGQVVVDMETQGESQQFFKCEECGEKVRTSRGLKIHNKRVHGHLEVVYDRAKRQECIMCLECQQLYKSEFEYKEHLKQFHAIVNDVDVDEEIKREICHTLDGIKMEIADEDAVESTIADKPGGSLEEDAETEFQCNICNDMFTTIDGVKKHAHCHYPTTEAEIALKILVPRCSEELSNMTSEDNTQSEDQTGPVDKTGSIGKTYSEIYPVSCVVANVDTSLLNYEKLFGVPVVQLRRLILPTENVNNSEDDTNTLAGDDTEDNAESLLDSVESEERNDQSTILSESFGTADTELELEVVSDSIGDEDMMNNRDITSANNSEEESYTLSNNVEDHAALSLNAVEREQKADQSAIVSESFATRDAELELELRSDNLGEEGKENSFDIPNAKTLENESNDVEDNVKLLLDSVESD